MVSFFVRRGDTGRLKAPLIDISLWKAKMELSLLLRVYLILSIGTLEPAIFP